MRKSFLTKAVVAVGVMVSAMAMSSVYAWAGTTDWLSFDSDGNYVAPAEEFGFTFSSTTKETFSNSRTGEFTDKIFSGKTTGATKGQSGFDINANTDTSNEGLSLDKSISCKPTKSGTIKLYIARDGSTAGSDDNSVKDNTGSIRTYEVLQKDDGSYYRASDTIHGYKLYSGRTETNIPAIPLTVEAGKSYTIYANNNHALLMGATFEYEDEATLVSDSLAEIKDLSANGLNCKAKYAKVDGTHYLVLDFTKNDALKNASALTYSVSGQTDKTISELYTGVQFDADGKDVLSAENHLYYAFKFTDTNNAYTNLGATISIAD